MNNIKNIFLINRTYTRTLNRNSTNNNINSFMPNNYFKNFLRGKKYLIENENRKNTFQTRKKTLFNFSMQHTSAFEENLKNISLIVAKKKENLLFNKQSYNSKIRSLKKQEKKEIQSKESINIITINKYLTEEIPRLMKIQEEKGIKEVEQEIIKLLGDNILIDKNQKDIFYLLETIKIIFQRKKNNDLFITLSYFSRDKAIFNSLKNKLVEYLIKTKKIFDEKLIKEIPYLISVSTFYLEETNLQSNEDKEFLNKVLTGSSDTRNILSFVGYHIIVKLKDEEELGKLADKKILKNKLQFLWQQSLQEGLKTFLQSEKISEEIYLGKVLSFRMTPEETSSMLDVIFTQIRELEKHIKRLSLEKIPLWAIIKNKNIVFKIEDTLILKKNKHILGKDKKRNHLKRYSLVEPFSVTKKRQFHSFTKISLSSSEKTIQKFSFGIRKFHTKNTFLCSDKNAHALKNEKKMKRNVVKSLLKQEKAKAQREEALKENKLEEKLFRIENGQNILEKEQKVFEKTLLDNPEKFLVPVKIEKNKSLNKLSTIIVNFLIDIANFTKFNNLQKDFMRLFFKEKELSKTLIQNLLKKMIKTKLSQYGGKIKKLDNKLLLLEHTIKPFGKTLSEDQTKDNFELLKKLRKEHSLLNQEYYKWQLLFHFLEELSCIDVSDISENDQNRKIMITIKLEFVSLLDSDKINKTLFHNPFYIPDEKHNNPLKVFPYLIIFYSHIFYQLRKLYIISKNAVYLNKFLVSNSVVRNNLNLNMLDSIPLLEKLFVKYFSSVFKDFCQDNQYGDDVSLQNTIHHLNLDKIFDALNSGIVELEISDKISWSSFFNKEHLT